MCGIAGVLAPRPSRAAAPLDETVKAMADRLAHRGPDDSGVWVDPEAGIGLGHRRLSILDLSAMGRQPMVSISGRYVLVYNGEIYNFEDLRSEVDRAGTPHPYRGHSDTEVMLAAFERWGIQDATRRFNGMFAFAVWDREERILHLGRDRAGQKPLFYGWCGRTFLFGSELKALRAHPEFQGKIDRRALTLFMRYMYVPSPYSIYEGVFKLPPGCILSLPLAASSDQAGFSQRPCDGNGSRKIAPLRYWSAQEAAERGTAEPFAGSQKQASERLEALLSDSVKMRMVSDVPLGVLLSGGIDSSMIAALMQAQSSRPIKTFSIGFEEAGFDEAVFARKVAAHLGTEHTELYVSARDAMDVIPRLPRIYDEPFADSSQIPTCLVSELARRHVTVALSGDGGDEVLGGYNRYFVAPAIWRKIRWMPLPLRRALARLLLLPKPSRWEAAEPLLASLFREYGRKGTFRDKIPKAAAVLSMPDPDALYERLCSAWDKPEQAVRGGEESAPAPANGGIKTGLSDPVERMMLFDLLTYLPDDILTKVDRASMAVSLETRSPFLDHRVIEFAWTLPLGMKIKDGRGKLPLREILYKHVPRNLLERPKAGFAVPIASWLRGPLREWAEERLSDRSLRASGLLEAAPIRELWEDHSAGNRDHNSQLWCVLMFQEWYKSL